MNNKNYSAEYNFIHFLKSRFARWGFSYNGLINNRNGEWYFIAQLIIIFAHLLQPWPNLTNNHEWTKYTSIIGFIIIIRGLVLSVKAFKDLGDSLSPLPEPMSNSKLIKYNSYAFTRHPLYKSLILLSLGLTILLFSLLHLLLLSLLTIVLKVKALREENKLKKIHSDYCTYVNDVPAIFKGIIFLDWRS